MPGYVLNSDTVGYYKFSTDEWTKNSMSDTSLSFQSRRMDSSGYSNTTKPGPREKTIYKSRGSSLRITETDCIWTNLPYTIGGSMTVDFWFYPKTLGNTTNPSNNVVTGYYSGSPSANNIAHSSNPFLYNYGIWTDGLKSWDFHSDAGNYKAIIKALPVLVQVSYDTYRNRFGLGMFSSRNVIGSVSSTGTGYNTSYLYIEKFQNFCPPNRWYHVAIVHDANTVYLYINGKNISGSASGFSFDDFTSTMSDRSIQNLYRFRSGTISGYVNRNASYYAPGNPTNHYISIGNRALPCCGPYNYSYSGTTNPGFQDVIIDDLRITKGVLYSGATFTPPGMAGYQLAYVNDDVYGYNDTYQFVKIASGWDAKTPAQKQSIINTMGMMDIVIDDLKSIPMNPGDDLHMEVYAKDSTQLSCELIDNSYETTVLPSSLLDNPIPGSEVRGLEFHSSLTEDSYIKVLLTKDLSTYQTYDFTNSQWMNCNIADISTQGIPIDQVKDIPKADMTTLGDSFAFAYFLHLEPYESDCSIDKIDITISLTYGWEHQNQSKANYEYPMLSQLRVVFYEDGDFKVNYMDKP